MYWWECSECLLEFQADPTGHSDWGGKIHIDAPSCPECGSEHVDLDDDQDEE
jgi:hypothetical protein